MTTASDGEAASASASGVGQGKSPWAEVVGPCYTAESLSRVVNVSRAALADAADNLIVLRLRTADGVDLFPAFQVRNGRVCPNLRPVLRTLQIGVDDPWTWAQWLNADLLNSPSLMSRLWAGDLDGVLRHAGHDAWAWRS